MNHKNVSDITSHIYSPPVRANGYILVNPLYGSYRRASGYATYQELRGLLRDEVQSRASGCGGER
jgi:hypothetical protein